MNSKYTSVTRRAIKTPLDERIVKTTTDFMIVTVPDILEANNSPQNQYWATRYRMDRLVRFGVLQVTVKRRQRFYSFAPGFGEAPSQQQTAAAMAIARERERQSPPAPAFQVITARGRKA